MSIQIAQWLGIICLAGMGFAVLFAGLELFKQIIKRKINNDGKSTDDRS